MGAAQAKAMGMVDEVVPKAELLAAATAEVKRRIAFPDPGRVATKHFLRKEARCPLLHAAPRALGSHGWLCGWACRVPLSRALWPGGRLRMPGWRTATRRRRAAGKGSLTRAQSRRWVVCWQSWAAAWRKQSCDQNQAISQRRNSSCSLAKIDDER